MPRETCNYEASRLGSEPDDEAHAQAGDSRRDGARGAVGGAGPLITPYAPEGRRERPPFSVETMLRVHLMEQWSTLSDPAMEDALHDMSLVREFAGLNWDTAEPDDTTILRFRRLLEEHKLAPQILALGNELLGAKGLWRWMPH